MNPTTTVPDPPAVTPRRTPTLSGGLRAPVVLDHDAFLLLPARRTRRPGTAPRTPNRTPICMGVPVPPKDPNDRFGGWK